ncbi:Alpha-(1,3)-fucosyltransferase 7 [Sparganum proliferum]
MRSRCRRRKSQRKGSTFEKSQLTIRTIMKSAKRISEYVIPQYCNGRNTGKRPDEEAQIYETLISRRPIVSLKGTPTYGLAKWLFRRLKFLTAESDTTVPSSAHFLEKLKEDLAIETIELLLQSKYDEKENRLGRAQVLQLLKFCLRTYFTFDGTIYEQVKGTPMGSPISGYIAEAVLQRLESLVFQHHKPKFWTRYVDDTFVVIVRDQLLTFKERLNAVFPDIQFTMEEEENNQLAFLDVLICRKDCGGLKTKVFRKATNTMQVLNFNSNHPISHKRSCVRTLYRRVETHCSEPEDKIAELQYLRRVFKANGYPRNFVNRCIRERDERPNRTDTKVWRDLPYVKNVSEAVGRLFAPLGVGVAHRLEATIRRQVMKPKDPLPRQDTSGVVYRIWCSCGESNYVGETGRKLQTRMAEHAAAVRRNDASSQVAAHSTGSGHTFKFDEAEILARGDNRVSRELLESWFTGPQSINKCNYLPIQYSVLRLRLGGVIGHAGSAQVNTRPNTRVALYAALAIYVFGLKIYKIAFTPTHVSNMLLGDPYAAPNCGNRQISPDLRLLRQLRWVHPQAMSYPRVPPLSMFITYHPFATVPYYYGVYRAFSNPECVMSEAQRERLRRQNSLHLLPAHHLRRTKKVAWAVSDNEPLNNRTKLGNAIAKYIEVDRYGRRAKHCPLSWYCFEQLSREHKFYLSFENANCDGYITEKFFVNALAYGMVPIVYGVSREEFYARAPPNSYIHVDDFKTVKDLASYLNYLDKNDTAYASYFAWKELGEVLTWLRVDCRVCGVLHHVLSGRLKLFDSTYKTYLDETRTCTNTSQINF